MDRVFVLLQQEGYLFRSCLTTGLTALRKADLNDPGMYYTAFFQLSIGLERLLKSIFVIDTIAATGSPPSEKELRRYSHDLLELLAAATKSDSPPSSSVLETLAEGGVNRLIFSFLSKFAKRTRYFNLDALSGNVALTDPIDDWDEIVRTLLLQDEDLAALDYLYRQTDLTESALRMAEMFRLRQAQELAAVHAVVRLLRILAALRVRLSEVVDAAHERWSRASGPQIPYMIEFLHFTYGTDAENRRKKRWP
jgi:hypothetical protein